MTLHPILAQKLPEALAPFPQARRDHPRARRLLLLGERPARVLDVGDIFVRPISEWLLESRQS